jgi:ComF family protein
MKDSSFNSIIKKILDLLFPPTDETKQLRKLSNKDLVKLPTHRIPEKSFIEAVCDYRYEKVRDVVYALKFSESKLAAEIIGELLQEEILAICQEHRIFADKIVITPIPLSANRKRERGFNQSKRVCEAIADNDNENIFVHKQLLEKTRQTADQTELSKSERCKNVRGVFRTTKKINDEATIYVIDDVTTTGATLAEARRALREVTDAKIIGIAFAH